MPFQQTLCRLKPSWRKKLAKSYIAALLLYVPTDKQQVFQQRSFFRPWLRRMLPTHDSALGWVVRRDDVVPMTQWNLGNANVKIIRVALTPRLRAAKCMICGNILVQRTPYFPFPTSRQNIADATQLSVEMGTSFRGAKFLATKSAAVRLRGHCKLDDDLGGICSISWGMSLGRFLRSEHRNKSFVGSTDRSRIGSSYLERVSLRHAPLNLLDTGS